MIPLRHLLPALALGLSACSGEVPEGADYEKRRAPPVTELTESQIADMSITDVADTLIDGGNEVKDLLATVDGEQSARDILPELEELADGYARLFQRFETMDELGFADMAALAARTPRVVAAQQGVVEQITRIDKEHPEAREVLREALEDFGQSKGIEVETQSE